MSAAPALLVRRWSERRPVVLVAAAIGLAGISVLVHLSGDPALGMLHVVPVVLVALELGAVGGLVAASVAAAFIVASGAIVPAVPAIAVGLIGGRFSHRMAGLHERQQRLLDSAIVLSELAAHERLPQAVAAAAMQMPGATGVEVALEDHGRSVAGEVRGAETTAGIVVRGEQLGTIQLSHRGRLEREDRAALELLAVQTGLAADNHRLLVQEREAAAIEAELRHIRDDLLEQRDGLSLLLDAEEDGRRRHAKKLHEELAQVLAGVLMQLRMSPRDGAEDGSLKELHDEVRGVLAELRDIATALRPSTLAHLGLLPALEAMDGLTVAADNVPDPLPEPLRTGVFRLVEHVVGFGRPGARVGLSGHGDRLDVVIDAELTGSEVLAAARARAALLGGAMRTEAAAGGRTRLRVDLPLTSVGDRTMRHPLSA